MPSHKPHVLLMGQTPPPWHGQAVATQLLFDHTWPEFEVHRLRMEFSGEMLEVGRFQWKKVRYLVRLILRARTILKLHPGCVLFYPPASAKWIPFLRDVAFLACVRYLAGSTVFIFHASGLPVFVQAGWVRRMLGLLVYRVAEVVLEVAQEEVSPHQAFAAKTWQWCPCAIEVPELSRGQRAEAAPLTVLFVGSLQEGKGVLEILKTASWLKTQGREGDFRFRIVGKWFSQEFEEAARHLRAELELDGMVDFVGQLTGADKWRAYTEADVFFFPTHYSSEATPLVLMEALGAGLPIVSTLWAGIPAMLDGCTTAHLLPVRSPAQYAAALTDLYSCRHRQAESEQASRAFYRANFLPERFVERVEKAFASALAVSPCSSGATKSAKPVFRSPSARYFGESVSEMRKTEREAADLFSPTEPPKHRSTEAPCHEVATEPPKIRITAYLADQNPGHDRSFGISRMSQVVLQALQAGGQVRISTISSWTSQQAPEGVEAARILPWGTRGKWVRLLTDHFHPLFGRKGASADLYYFPKGYLPLLDRWCRPSVVTIHDTIIQHDNDHYPHWRNSWEYGYWAMMLKHTLRNANLILTVSESSKQQIHAFMDRHGIARKEITVTYEPCLYESLPQPRDDAKDNYVIHLASGEPHKRTAHLVRWWHEAESQGLSLPMLHLVGTVPPEVLPLLTSSRTIVKRPFLAETALQAAYRAARALILPSEIEGFGLPALEAYYLGTPVCFVQGTSVEEVLGVATRKGGFSLASAASLFDALDEVMTMSPAEIHHCGLQLREAYAASKVAAKIVAGFRQVAAVPDFG